MTENEARERLIDAIHGEQANYCGPGYGTCGSVTLAKAEASDLVGLILAALRADPALAAAALRGEVMATVHAANYALAQTACRGDRTCPGPHIEGCFALTEVTP